MLSTTIPGATYETVTPSDSADLAQLARAIILDIAGTVKVTDANGNPRVLQLPAGRHDLLVKRVWAASLTANLHVTVVY